MLWVWLIPWVVLVFLWTLNEFLRGRQKELIAGVLSTAMFGFVVVAFFVSGWKVGLGALLGSFVLSALFRPVALRVARKLIDAPDLGFDRGHDVDQIMADVASGEYWSRAEQEKERDEEHRATTIAAVLKERRIATILADAGATERDLIALYDRVEVLTLPRNVRRTVLRNPRIVRFFLANSTPATAYDGAYTRNLDQNGHLRLQLWTHSNPGGDEPRFR